MLVMLDHSVSHLMGDIWSSITDVSIHLAHNSDMLVAVEKGVLLLALCAGSAISCSPKDSLVCLETSVRKNHDQSLGVFIG